jgi:hypothetical protein
VTLPSVNRLAAGLLLAAVLAVSPAATARAATNAVTTPWWWDLPIAAASVTCSAALLHCLLARRDPRLWAAGIAGTTAFGIVTFPLVASEPLAVGELPWVAVFAPTAAGALGVALAWGWALALATAFALMHALAQGTAAWPIPEDRRLTDFVFLVVCTVSVAATMEALRAPARRVDAARDQTIEASAHAARQAAYESEASRWDALVHDEVLATLDTVRSGGASLPAVRRMARDAVDAFTHPPPRDAVPATELVAHLNQLATTAGARADATVYDGQVTLPGEVADALQAATSEAVNNSRRHAGSRAAIAIDISVAASGVQITVVDDGPGFDPSRIPAGRMGFAVSIVGRMRAVGGNADVRAQTGRGASVTLTWAPRA